MPDKIHVELGSVQKTLLLPLWGRAMETLREVPCLVDQMALDVVNNVDYDFDAMTANLNPITRLAWIARSFHIDRTIKKFLARHPRASIVNLGCGLDTTFDRVDNGVLQWYDLDLPDVIKLRNTFIKPKDRVRVIAGSLLDEGWKREIRTGDGVLFIAAGVLYYFEEREMKDFFAGMVNAFPNGEIMFDAASHLGVRIANKLVIEAGGLDETSYLKWGIDSARKIRLWDKRLKVVEAYPMFKRMRKDLTLKGWLVTVQSDILNIMYMVHLKFLTSR